MKVDTPCDQLTLPQKVVIPVPAVRRAVTAIREVAKALFSLIFNGGSPAAKLTSFFKPISALFFQKRNHTPPSKAHGAVEVHSLKRNLAAAVKQVEQYRIYDEYSKTVEWLNREIRREVKASAQLTHPISNELRRKVDNVYTEVSDKLGRKHLLSQWLKERIQQLSTRFWQTKIAEEARALLKQLQQPELAVATLSDVGDAIDQLHDKFETFVQMEMISKEIDLDLFMLLERLAQVHDDLATKAEQDGQNGEQDG